MTKKEYKEALEQYKAYSQFLQRATIDSVIRESEAEKQQRIKRLLKPENYGFFFNYYLGKDTPGALADSDCAWFHSDSYAKLHKNPYLTQFRLWFRGAAKSIHSNVGNPLALKQAGLIKFFLVIGANELRAKMLLADLQAQFESNRRITSDFGKQVSYGSWADGAFETEDGCYFMALGIDQPFRGLRRYANRLDLVSVDDVEDRKVAQNERIVKERTEKITSDLMPAFGKSSQRLVISNNLIEKNGVVASLMQKLKHPKYTDVMKVNFVNEKGEPEWKERYNKADVVRTRQKTDQYTWLREYMNTPVNEGKLFKAEWLRYKNTDDISQYISIVGHWDLSYTAEGDYKAFALIGNTGTEMHVLDIFCRKCELSEAVDYHFRSAKALQTQGASAAYYFDATAAQQEVFMPLFVQKANEFQNFAIPMPAHVSVDKYLRIEATLTAVLFNKRLFFSKDIKTHPDWEDAKTQLLAFEKGSKAHDDFPDTLEAAVRLSQTQTGYGNTGQSPATPIFGKQTIKGY